MTLFIDHGRLKADFNTLALIGGVPDDHGNWGVHRPSFSSAHLEARRWFLARAAESGLESRVDTAGNHSAILRAQSPGRLHPGTLTLLLGSHLDSVPNGG